MQKHFEISKLAIEKEKIREQLRPVVAKAMQEAKDKDEFRKLLKERRIGVLFRTNEQGRIYGVTFMDYQNRAVLNGSRPGKEFSANVFNDRFNGGQKPVEAAKPAEQIRQTASPGLSPGSVFGLLDIAPSGDDYEAEAFAGRMEYESRKRRLRAKRKRGRGI